MAGPDGSRWGRDGRQADRFSRSRHAGVGSTGSKVPRPGVPADHLWPGLRGRRASSAPATTGGWVPSDHSPCANSHSESKDWSDSFVTNRLGECMNVSSESWHSKANPSTRDCSLSCITRSALPIRLYSFREDHLAQSLTLIPGLVRRFKQCLSNMHYHWLTTTGHSI